MKLLSLSLLALAASALVIPNDETIESLHVQDQEHEHPFWKNIKNSDRFWEELEDQFNEVADRAKDKFVSATEYVHDIAVDYSKDFQSAFASQAWIGSATEDESDDHPPAPGPPPHGPPHHGPPPPPHRGPGKKKPYHKPHKTVYQLIAGNEYTTKLAALINEFPDLVKALNGTKANYTVFAPTDKAFAKIPEGAPKPPKEFLKKLLLYHVSPEFYPAGRILVTRTIPTALEDPFLGNRSQRLSTQVGFLKLTVNFYARIVAANFFGSNGVVHGIDSLLLPPPKVVDILDILPTQFSTLSLGLEKTGLYELYNNTDLHQGGTLFAPSNFAFALLGPRVNAFLFSPYGLKYLKALLLYHSVPDITLYSDAIYKADSESTTRLGRIPKGKYHIDLPTGLEGKSLSVDIIRFGRLIDVRLNGFADVSVPDGVAADGVIHLLSHVLVPPKEPGALAETADGLSVEELQERLAPFVETTEEDLQWELK